MNGARYRRQAIRERARHAMIRRISQERVTRKKGHDIVMPSDPEPRVEGRVYLNYDQHIEGNVTTSVWVDLPARGFMRTLNDMQARGFWAPRPHNKELIFVPAGRILQASLMLKED